MRDRFARHAIATAALLTLAACSQEPAPAEGVPPDVDADDPQALSTPALDATTPAQRDAWEALLRRLDRNGDGVVARSEHGIGAAVMFARMDRDGDSAVTVEEMANEREALLDTPPTDTAERLAQVDTNKDGSLDSREHDAATRLVFDQYDRDADTRLVREEFLEALAAVEAQAGR
jgi:Ca2+-binding EF-hand superfamily protein